MTAVVLVLNCGSSSVKFALIDPADGTRHLTGLADRVGSAQVTVQAGSAGVPIPIPAPAEPGHRAVLERILATVGSVVAERGLRVVAIGHRIAHGGEAFAGPVLLDQAAVGTVQQLADLAPLHNPANLAGVSAAASLWPDTPAVGVFDTAFHHGMPPHAYRYAVPDEWYKKWGVRRYGFHGTSHAFVAAGAAGLLGRPLAQLRLVTVHLGNGCSVTAVRGGTSVDTSMGMTPLEGLVMGTRSGDLDPGVPGYLAARTGTGLDQITDELNRGSGLLGLSGVSNDMRAVQQAAAGGNAQAQLALEVFGYRVAKYVASYLVPLGGLDAVVFTGGIGENSVDTRADVVGRLAFLGWQLDRQANAAAVGGTAGRIAGCDDGTGPVALVVPTDEEYVIARQAAGLVGADLGEVAR